MKQENPGGQLGLALREAVLPCGDLKLEAILHLPGVAGRLPLVVLCHPHPLYGGSMDNTVVLSMAEALEQEGFIALRFNFRGVGRSQGSYGGGVAEEEDIRAALAFASSLKEATPGWIGLAGYSFGARVALGVGCHDDRVKALAAISPPLSSLTADLLEGCTKPKLFIMGDRDHVSAPETLQAFLTRIPQPKESEVVPGADHFWFGFEDKVARRLAAFFGALSQRGASAPS